MLDYTLQADCCRYRRRITLICPSSTPFPSLSRYVLAFSPLPSLSLFTMPRPPSRSVSSEVVWHADRIEDWVTQVSVRELDIVRFCVPYTNP